MLEEKLALYSQRRADIAYAW